MNLILIGAQGSGKGTQAQMLADRFGLVPCASGDLLRDEIARATPLGREAKAYYDRGDLVPDEIIVKMILARMRELSGRPGIILDGFPRTIPQARTLDERLTALGSAIDRVVSLEVPRDAAPRSALAPLYLPRGRPRLEHQDAAAEAARPLRLRRQRALSALRRFP